MRKRIECKLPFVGCRKPALEDSPPKLDRIRDMHWFAVSTWQNTGLIAIQDMFHLLFKFFSVHIKTYHPSPQIALSH